MKIYKKSLVRVVLALFTVFLIWFFGHALLITLSGLQDNLGPADVAVIFGNEVALDGRPSPRLQARLDKAIEVYEKGFTTNLIVSGGVGKEGFDEAVVMAEYLMEHQIPKDKIVMDSAGLTTEATVENSVKIMEQRNWHSVIVVSQYFHVARAKLAFEKSGLKQIYSASPYYFEWRDFYSVPREFFAYYAYVWR